MITENTDKLIQYILLLASEADDFRDRELGPIHLLKYVYLSDFIYAEEKDGNTYTQANWWFYKFGPWDSSVLERIEPALEVVHADKKVISHPRYKADFVRWKLKDDDLLRKIEEDLPLSIVFGIKSLIRNFGSDTASLLDYVYSTEPMLKAAPGESLSFVARKGRGAVSNDSNQDNTPPSKQPIAVERLRDKMQEKLSALKKRVEFVEPDPPPRYDDVYEKGIAWLDSLAGTPTEGGDYKVEISDDCWKSKARYDSELPSNIYSKCYFPLPLVG